MANIKRRTKMAREVEKEDLALTSGIIEIGRASCRERV